MDQILEWTGWVQALLPALFRQQMLALLALVVADVLLGIAVAAFRTKRFEWLSLGLFYQSMVLPYLIGWAAFAVLAKLSTPAILGPEIGPLAAEGVTWLAWLVVVSSIGASIIRNAKVLYGQKIPFRLGE